MSEDVTEQYTMGAAEYPVRWRDPALQAAEVQTAHDGRSCLVHQSEVQDCGDDAQGKGDGLAGEMVRAAALGM